MFADMIDSCYAPYALKHVDTAPFGPEATRTPTLTPTPTPTPTLTLTLILTLTLSLAPT